MVKDQGTKYKYLYENGEMTWFYYSSGKLYEDWGNWYLQRVDKLKISASNVSSLYRSKAQEQESIETFFLAIDATQIGF